MYARACGYAGMSRNDFWSSTLAEINCVITGVQDKEYDRAKVQWEVARWQTVIMLNPFIKKKFNKVTDLQTFDWDEGVSMQDFDAKVVASRKRWANKKLVFSDEAVTFEDLGFSKPGKEKKQ